MRVFVTGGAGFVAGHLLQRLHEASAEVTAVDREVDVADADAISAAVRDARPQAILHLAAQSSVAESFQDPLACYRINYRGSANVLAAARQHAPQARVVLIGSSDCYGATPVSDRPLREDDALHPVSPYARSKAAAEQLGSVAAARGQDVVRVRAFTHIGPGQTPVFVASSFARQIATAVRAGRDPILHVGNLDSVRDFLDVRDVVDAYARLLDPKVAPDVYNVASGRGRPIREVLEGLCAIAGVQPKVEVDADLYRPTESRIGDASRLRGATGWEPRIAFADTLRDLFEWWLERVAS